MGGKKQSTSKKRPTSKKQVQVRDLATRKRSLSEDQAKKVKGGSTAQWHKQWIDLE